LLPPGAEQLPEWEHIRPEVYPEAPFSAGQVGHFLADRPRVALQPESFRIERIRLLPCEEETASKALEEAFPSRSAGALPFAEKMS